MKEIDGDTVEKVTVCKRRYVCTMGVVGIAQDM